MNILLTGGAGYVGSHVALALLDKGFKVTIIDSLETGYKKLVPKKAIFIKEDFANTKALNLIFNEAKYDALIHLAAYIKVDESIKYPKKYFTNNFNKSKILFDYCISRGLKNIVFSSTAAVYGKTKKKTVNERSKTEPINPYGKSKLLTEKYLLKLSKKKNIKCSILRYFNVAGADAKLRSGHICKNATHLIKIACEVAVGKRKKLIIHGNNYSTLDGTAIRDYIHVSDIAEIHIHALKYLKKKKKTIILNCGYGKGFSVKQVVKEINKLLSKPLTTKIGSKRKGDTSLLVADNKKMKKVISWIPKYNKLSTILSSAFKWEKKILRH